MLYKIFGRLKKEHIFGGLAVTGTLFFGYKNLQNYLQYNNTTPVKLNKNELLNENLSSIYNNFNKKDLSLRTGDLIFIKYNLDKLSFFNKYKLLLLRNLSIKRIFDDIGLVYSNDKNVYILLMPTVGIRNRSNITELGISDRGRGVFAIELDDFLKENRPDLVSVRRLICSNTTRNNLIKSLKSTITELKHGVNSGIYSLVTNWLGNVSYYSDRREEFIKALTLSDDLNYTIQLLINTTKQLFDTLSRNLGHDLGTIDTRGGEKFEKANTSYSSEIIDSLIDVEEKLNQYEAHLQKYNNIIKNYTQSSKINKLKINNVNLKKYILGEMDLVNKIYSKTNLLPKNGLNFSMNNFFGMDSLYNGTGESEADLRLSSPFNVYTGSVNKIRFQNLKYPQIQDILDYKH
ncbi:hypothetical protein TpMuguga_03g00295 [Theileria parva strain Muguga]|uniref:Uncharacterized protein n=1 Tax=Theileria parva TaxID=5875 RepID=Q4N059_THEPA|nr:uncharacterized protein TpMuguga_03g00295 [Theileria parva strain Muguga]EAN31030.1 hypothetical protein TpMuguga_03g00295 [Theileria parva strain Muguga]|eukprot:XP_763313.1 hypothetical protein [Theileria parva strain Muguga]